MTVPSAPFDDADDPVGGFDGIHGAGHLPGLVGQFVHGDYRRVPDPPARLDQVGAASTHSPGVVTE